MKVYTKDTRDKLSAAWLGFLETDSILIKGKCERFLKTSDRVSKKVVRYLSIE